MTCRCMRCAVLERTRGIERVERALYGYCEVAFAIFVGLTGLICESAVLEPAYAAVVIEYCAVT